MTSNEQLKAQLAELDAAIEYMQEQRSAILAQLAAAPSQDEMWEGPDANGGFVFVPHKELKEKMLASGDRNLVYASKANKTLNTVWLTVMEGVEPTQEFLDNFGRAKGSRVFLGGMDGYSTKLPLDAAGNELEGYAVLWHGNEDWHASRDYWEDKWELGLEALYEGSKDALETLDAEWQRLQSKYVPQFYRDYWLKKHPHYTPPA